MRQVGLIAAAGIVAVETMCDRLVDDFRHARILAEGQRSPGQGHVGWKGRGGKEQREGLFPFIVRYRYAA